MKTQQEVNNFFQENTVHVSAIYQIVQYLKDFNLKLPNNVILHEKGIGQAHFFKWFDNGPFKPGDVLVTQAGNLALFSHLEKDVVYYHCILKPFGCFSIKPGCGIGKSKDCYIASDDQKQRLWDNLKHAGYEFDSKTNSLKKIAKYPTTYVQCKGTLSFKQCAEYACNLSFKYAILLKDFDRLLLCRDAYWKIAGDELKLDKPWEPDFTNDNEERYGIYTTANKVEKDFCGVGDVNVILTFPTEEMRDAFYENFKDLIEKCKELL